eukprot:12413495-Karenia_brevis.AAC.1
MDFILSKCTKMSIMNKSWLQQSSYSPPDRGCMSSCHFSFPTQHHYSTVLSLGHRSMGDRAIPVDCIRAVRCCVVA